MAFFNKNRQLKSWDQGRLYDPVEDTGVEHDWATGDMLGKELGLGAGKYCTRCGRKMWFYTQDEKTCRGVDRWKTQSEKLRERLRSNFRRALFGEGTTP